MTVPEAPRNQRIVLEHTTGPYKGLFQVLGHTDEFEGEQPPLTSEVFTITPGERQGQSCLVASHPRYLLYREITAPEGLGTFHKDQR